MSPERASGPPERRGRASRLFGCLVTAPLGCLAFLVGSVVAVVAMTPYWVSGSVARGLEEDFAQDFEGTLEIEELELAWLERESLRNFALRAPGGETVLRGSATFPGLVRLFETGFDDLGQIDVTVEELHVVVGADGRTNLARALAPSTATSAGFERSFSVERGAALRGRLDVQLERCSFVDERHPQSAIELEDVACKLDFARGARLLFEVQGGGELGIDVAFALVPGAAGQRAQVDVERLVLAQVPSALVDGLTGAGATFQSLLGPIFALEGHARAPSGAGGPGGDVRLALRSARAQLVFEGLRDDDGVVRARGAGLSGTLQWSPEIAELSFGRALAAAGLVRAEGAGPFVIAAESLELPLERLFSEGRAALAGSAAELEVGLGDWEWRYTAADPDGRAPVPLRGVRLAGSLSGAQGPVRLALADQDGGLDVALFAPDAAALLGRGAERGAGALPTLEVVALPAVALERFLPPGIAVELGRAPLAAELESAALRRADARLPRLSGALRAALPRIVLRERHGAGRELELAGLELGLQRSASGGTSAELHGELLSADRGTLSCAVSFDAPGAPAVVDLAATAVPSWIADAWLGLDGFAVDVFGPELDGLQLGLERGSEPLVTLRAVSSEATAVLSGVLRAGALVAREHERSSLRFALSRASAERVLRPLLPLFARLEPEPEEQPEVELVLSAYSLPLAAGSGSTSAAVELELPRLRYELLPELARRLELEPDGASGVLPARRVQLELEAGSVRHTRLSVPVSGAALDFAGTYQLERDELNLSSRVPLELFLPDRRILELVRGVVGEGTPESTAVVVVQGSTEHPTVLLDSLGLNELLLGLGEKALRGLLERQ